MAVDLSWMSEAVPLKSEAADRPEAQIAILCENVGPAGRHSNESV